MQVVIFSTDMEECYLTHFNEKKHKKRDLYLKLIKTILPKTEYILTPNTDILDRLAITLSSEEDAPETCLEKFKTKIINMRTCEVDDPMHDLAIFTYNTNQLVNINWLLSTKNLEVQTPTHMRCLANALMVRFVAWYH